MHGRNECTLQITCSGHRVLNGDMRASEKGSRVGGTCWPACGGVELCGAGLASGWAGWTGWEGASDTDCWPDICKDKRERQRKGKKNPMNIQATLTKGDMV